MECTLATLIACFSWSGLFVDTGIAYQDKGEQWSGYFHPTDKEPYKTANWRHNPYGRFGLGYEIQFRTVRWSIEAIHVSSIATNEDRGVNSIGISARWFPFRQ